jgi:type VI protein secretion system component Hcp
MLARLRSHLTYANVIASLALFLALGGGAYAAVSAIPSADGTIHGCYATSDGALRVIAAGHACTKHEKVLAWNEEGRRGATGARGTTGATGPQGAAGAQGPAGAAGAAWLAGAAGVNGTDGAIGPAGPQGPGAPVPATAVDDSDYVLTLNEPGGTITVPLSSFLVSVMPDGTSGDWSLTFVRPHDDVSAKLAKLVAAGTLALDGKLTATRKASASDGGHAATGPYASWALHNVALTDYYDLETGERSDSGTLTFSRSATTPTFTADDSLLPDTTVRRAGTVTYDLGGGSATSDLYGLSWGVTNHGSPASFHDLALIQRMDATGPRLLDLLRANNKILTVTIKLQDPSEPQAHQTYVLKNAGVDMLGSSGAPGGGQQVTLNYTRVTTTSLSADGHTSATTCWDVTSNAAC